MNKGSTQEQCEEQREYRRADWRIRRALRRATGARQRTRGVHKSNVKNNGSIEERTGEYGEHFEEQREPDREQGEYTRAILRTMGVPENELENTESTLKSNGSQIENKGSTEEQCDPKQKRENTRLYEN